MLVFLEAAPLPAGAQEAWAKAAEPPAAEELVSMEFRQTEIGDVLRLLAKQYGLNIILSEEVKGPVSVQFSDVSLEEALDSIITVNGYTYSRKGRVIRVTTAEMAEKEIEREIPTTRLFPLKYAGAKLLAESLASVLSAQGAVRPDERSNTLVITDVPSVLETVEEVVGKLDNPSPQVLIETKIIETLLSDEERLGINWEFLASLQGAAAPTTFPFPQGFYGTRSLKQFEGTGQTAEESSTTSTTTTTTTASATAFPPGDKGVPKFPFVPSSLYTFGTLSFNQMKLILQALEARAHTKALSVPSITTLDNEEAQIVIGTNVPVPTFAQNKNTGEFEITGYEDRKTGVVLRVTPHVTLDQRIILEVHPQVSSIERFVGDPRAQVPVTSTREADTRVHLRDGETAVIGGLIEERDATSRRGVPLLGRVPFFGGLFRFKQVTRTRTELLIFITARILTDRERLLKTLEAVSATGRPELFPPEIRIPLPEKKAGPKGPKPFKIQFEAGPLSSSAIHGSTGSPRTAKDPVRPEQGRRTNAAQAGQPADARAGKNGGP